MLATVLFMCARPPTAMILHLVCMLGDRVKPLVCCVVREATAIILSILHPRFTAAWPLRLSGREPKGRGVPEHGAYQCVDDPGNLVV